VNDSLIELVQSSNNSLLKEIWAKENEGQCPKIAPKKKTLTEKYQVMSFIINTCIRMRL